MNGYEVEKKSMTTEYGEDIKCTDLYSASNQVCLQLHEFEAAEQIPLAVISATINSLEQ